MPRRRSSAAVDGVVIENSSWRNVVDAWTWLARRGWDVTDSRYYSSKPVGSATSTVPDASHDASSGGPDAILTTIFWSGGSWSHHRGLRTRTTSLPGTTLCSTYGPAERSTAGSRVVQGGSQPVRSRTWAGSRSSKRDCQSA